MNHEKITKILVVMTSLLASYSAMAVSYYGLNDDGMHAAAIIHAFPQTVSVLPFILLIAL
ncbi:hypothetical protein E4659_17660 [Dickeya dianthicola]|uniref:Uncharacterized protein n=1 Tax=Dickeya dianthicola TaxID=204039 RepID=A0ABX9NS10_9GAMM|nr:hypothetical protein [Dickeya dianthicola]MBI0449943.1 hypothetical protein [Dickeya dianthicola]MBI0454555.1 hypothetical protein [Dickeya dianthicola]MBI0457493.1 hypothetical protein [Dickeya dianthicola]MBI0461388.1 hypothetical protein [Dickeya dianthicola]